MADYIVSKIERFPTYFTVSLKPADDSYKFDFLPGQYATISFKTDGRWSPVRCFSMTSSPADEELRFATRITGKFTDKLAGLRPGTSVKVRGPYGSFNIDPDFDRRIIMLAGGIGITPFMSMLRWAAKLKLRNPITLLYAGRSLEDMPFRAEIERLQRRNPRLQVAFLVSDGETDKSHNIFNRRIDDDLLAQVTDGRFDDFTFFVCGPREFTKTLEETLRKQGVDDNHLVIESFTQATQLGWGIKLSIPSLTYATASLALLAGIGFFMVVDLARYLPKVEAKTAPQSNPGNTTPAPSTQANTSSTAGGTTTSSYPSSASSSTYSSQTYQAPVTTVS